MKFTVESIAKLKLKPGEVDRFEWDDEVLGWGLRLRKRRAYWVFQYTTGVTTEKGRKQQRRLKFGTYPVMTVPEAREKARGFDAEVHLGSDPQAIKAENQARAGETVGACITRYLARRRNDVKLRASSYAQIERHLIRNLEKLHGLRIDRLDRRAIALELARFTDERGAVQANRTATSLGKFLKWCVGEGVIDANPAALINKNPEAPRDRALAVAELAQVWRGLPHGDFADVIRLLILTGQRKSEIADLEWGEIDFECRTITLAPPRTKNRRWHTVPLSAPAVEILKARRRVEGRKLVFGRGKGGRGFSGWSRCKERFDVAVQIPEWIIHDLRRSFSTGLGDLGIPPHIVEQLLNHQSGTRGGVAGIYNKSAYEREARLAVDLWAATVMAAVEGRASTVVPLRPVG